ncbi:hypothetical protein D4R78_07420 [bacterium]|nr:MAG: hypothetical protein D4R78_07420 [bacterium]
MRMPVSGEWGIFLVGCFLAACAKTPAPHLNEVNGVRGKTSKSPHALVVVCPKKEFLFLFLPPLIFCFQKGKENRNVKRIKSL